VGGYGYPGARIGPAAPGCAELAQRYRDLDRLFALRAQVEAEEKIVYAERGRMRVMDAGDIHEATALMGQEHQGNSDQTWEMVRRTRERLRDNSLAVLDQRIAATQQRANELAYQCQD
jgi:hypothetical protein